MQIQKKGRKETVSVWSVIAAAMLAVVGQPTQAGNGSCVDYEFPLNKEGLIERTQAVTVIRDGSIVYVDATLGNALTEKGLNDKLYPVKLVFNKKVKALKLQADRIQVKYISSDQALGWMNRSDLLCTLKPARSKTGLEKKLYIKTATAVRGSVTAVKAYPSPEQTDCPTTGCRELSRFTGYFIFDEEHGRYLLSDEYNLRDSSPLVGWVNKKDGFLWETAYGIRPRADLQIQDGKNAGQEGAMCVYVSLDEGKAKKNCRPVLGGNRWYTYPDRIPILDRNDDFYKVAVPVAGVSTSGGGGQQIKITGENLGIDSLQSMKNVDVFFLIDGTSSMEPYVRAVKDVVGNIINELSSHESYQETKFRFGFRIYRDDYAGKQGIGEGLPLSSRCEATDQDLLEKGRKEFELEISKVRVTKNEKDDFEENLFGGIVKAARDMYPCINNTKLLFIIGDHGYSAEKQKERGNTVITVESVTTKLKADPAQGFKNIVTFFIQTPKTGTYDTNMKYRQAYDRFNQQGRTILQSVLGSQTQISNYMLTTNDQGLSKKVVEGVSHFSRGDVINEMLLDLRGGASLVDVIERLQGSAQYGNLPVLFWDNVKNGSCKHLGDQCENKIYDTILEGYIPISDDLVEDVWLKAEDLERWRKILSKLEDIGRLSSTKQRMAFVIALTENLRQVLKGIYKHEQSFKEYIETRVESLPLRDNSPLFDYSYNKLMDKEQVDDCEINRLVGWVHNSKQMLDIVSLGTRLPQYSVIPYPTECVRRHDGSTIEIPYIDGAIKQTKLGPSDDYRFDHVFQKVRIYWVPKEFLP